MPRHNWRKHAERADPAILEAKLGAYTSVKGAYRRVFPEAPDGLLDLMAVEAYKSMLSYVQSLDSGSFVRALSSIPVFEGLDSSSLRELARSSTIMHFDPGSLISTQGGSEYGFCLILSGHAELRSEGRVLQSLSRGSFFGSLLPIVGEKTRAEVVALDSTQCLALSIWEFWGLTSSRPAILKAILQIASQFRIHRMRQDGR